MDFAGPEGDCGPIGDSITGPEGDCGPIVRLNNWTKDQADRVDSITDLMEIADRVDFAGPEGDVDR